MRVSRLLGLSVAAVLLSVPPVQAVPITLSYSGVIDFVDDPEGLLDPKVTLGAAFSADLTLDPATAFLNFVVLGGAFYTTSPGPEVSVSLGGAPIVDTWDGILIADDQSLDPGDPPDFWTQVSFVQPAPTDVAVGISYEDSTGAALSDNGFFVPSDSDFSGWDLVQLTFTRTVDGVTPDLLARGTIFLVPEPSTAVLLMLGLATLGFCRRS